MEVKEVNQEIALKKMEEAKLVVVEIAEDVILTSGTTIEKDCLASGTKITMADGTIKNIEDIYEGDNVLSFDHELGMFVSSPIMYKYQGDAPKCAFTLQFSNGSTLSIVGEHDLFNKECLKYTTITLKNANDYIGRHFYSKDSNGYVKLVSVKEETKASNYYELYTEKSLNMIANGMLNVADDVDYLLNIDDFNEELTINKDELKKDLQTSGAFEYQNMRDNNDLYTKWNMRYLNVAIDKGLITLDKIVDQHLLNIELFNNK